MLSLLAHWVNTSFVFPLSGIAVQYGAVPVMGVHWGGFFSVRLTLERIWEWEARYIWRGSCLIMFVIILIHPPLLTAHDLMNVWSPRLPPRVVRLTAPMPGVSGCRCTLVIALEYAIQNSIGNLLPGHHGPWREVGTIHPTNAPQLEIRGLSRLLAQDISALDRAR